VQLLIMQQHVMLRFPAAGKRLTRTDLYERTRLCAQAQRQCDAGEDIKVPEGVEIVVTVQ
jgi:hypothetical protein